MIIVNEKPSDFAEIDDRIELPKRYGDYEYKIEWIRILLLAKDYGWEVFGKDYPFWSGNPDHNDQPIPITEIGIGRRVERSWRPSQFLIPPITLQ